MYKNGIKIHSIVFLLIFSKKTCKIINKCITFAPSKDVVLQELCHTFAWQMYDIVLQELCHTFAWQMYDIC